MYLFCLLFNFSQITVIHESTVKSTHFYVRKVKCKNADKSVSVDIILKEYLTPTPKQGFKVKVKYHFVAYFNISFSITG